ncbi:hypothetical protein PFISCL1PPCAC_26792, partial [Pristionchus fissidentatus]
PDSTSVSLPTLTSPSATMSRVLLIVSLLLILAIVSSSEAVVPRAARPGSSFSAPSTEKARRCGVKVVEFVAGVHDKCAHGVADANGWVGLASQCCRVGCTEQEVYEKICNM